MKNWKAAIENKNKARKEKKNKTDDSTTKTATDLQINAASLTIGDDIDGFDSASSLYGASS